MDPDFLNLIGRMVLINTLPFFMVLSLVIRRRRQSLGSVKISELQLLSDEIKFVGVLGYVVILSLFFFSIPVLQYMHDKKGYDILLVAPDGYTVFLIAFLAFNLVVGGIYLKERHRVAYRFLLAQMILLLAGAFFSILDVGFIGIVPVIVFSYLLYKLKRLALHEDFAR